MTAGARRIGGRRAQVRAFWDSSVGKKVVMAVTGLIGIGYVDEVVRDACALVATWFGGPQVHAAIHGNRIATEDLAVEALGQRERESRLAASSGAEEDDGERQSPSG